MQGSLNLKFMDVQARFWLIHKLFVCFIGLSAHTHVELPYYSKFLLIAAYLASYNPVRTDKRFFLKVTKLIFLVLLTGFLHTEFPGLKLFNYLF